MHVRTSCSRSLLLLVLPVLLLPAGCGRSRLDPGEYYDTAATYTLMRAYARRHPDLARVYSIGQTLQGTDLLVMEVTNHATGPGQEKPALYVDGNIHAGELTGSAVTLYLMDHLLEKYGDDPLVTRLLDTRTFYLRPKFNPDGADLALNEDQDLRSTPRPVDEDDDGEADEDPPNDLNGDGWITQMRIPDPEGRFKMDAGDPRLMVRRARSDSTGPFFRVVSEGIDDDGDGRLNEDGYGGIDMNRNFPRNWALEYLQPGAGPYPLSEPETRATVEFIDAHPNITGVVHNHSSGGFVYRLPSATDPADFGQADMDLILELGSRYTLLTGRPVEPSSTDPVRHRYGTLISWAYWDRGIIGWVPEYWPGIQADSDGDGRTSEAERLAYNDSELGGNYFVDWTPQEHPEFGPVEIGGWKSRFISQNPPNELLEAECALQIPWILYLAGQSPLLHVSEPAVQTLGDGQYEIEVSILNEGYLPTNLTDRGIEARVASPVIAELEAPGAEIIEGTRRVRVGDLAGRSDAGREGRRQSATVRWVITVSDPTAPIQVHVLSPTGGTTHRTVQIDTPEAP